MVGKPLEAAADDLVIVAPERVARDVAERRIPEDGVRVGTPAAVVHAHADDSNGSRHQLRGTGATYSVACHVSELAVVAGVEPCEQRRFVRTQIAGGDRHLLKAQLDPPPAHRCGQRAVVDIRARLSVGHWSRSARQGASSHTAEVSRRVGLHG